MARLLGKIRVHKNNCGYGCCRGGETIGHGARRDPRVRRWTRKADKNAWKREESNG